MNVEALILAAASAVRPSTSLAAVYALLSSPSPRTPLGAFAAAGFTFSVAVGILVVTVLHGVDLPGGASARGAVVDLLGGTAMLGFAAGVGSGRVRRPGERRAPGGERRIVTMLRRPRPRVAAAAGVATHVPGLFYIVALDAIAADQPRTAEAILEVLAYNAIWFSVPIAAFVLLGRPGSQTLARVARVNGWARRHEQALLVAVFATVGAYLVVKGIAGLRG
jgi:Sap, sulfolipid-1-addressing protein